ncbi:MAG: MFS transporter, partial [Thermoplasmata archaeon]|nr:MFS transporter [Thermoplasmata archaeon]
MSITRGYLMYLVILMGLIGLLDWYLSTNIVIVLPSVLKEYSISKSTYSFWDAIYLIPTMFIFLLNGLNDIIGRKPSLLILLMMMGLPSIMIVFFASSFHLFMIFYAIISYALVSNMWTIPVEEEAPAEERGRLMGIVY